MMIIRKKIGRNKFYCSFVVAAAGTSQRMSGQNKLFAQVGGKPILAHTLTALQKIEEIDEIIVVTRAEDIAAVAELCEDFAIDKATKVICGGDTRLESALSGVYEVSPRASLIGIHDGARPFVPEDVVKKAIEAAKECSAAAPAVPVAYTVKYAEKGLVQKTVDRENLFEIQTPQVFSAEIIKAALKNAVTNNLPVTDDCMAVEAIGFPVKLTQGSTENIKLTTPVDIVFAEAIFQMRSGL